MEIKYFGVLCTSKKHDRIARDGLWNVLWLFALSFFFYPLPVALVGSMEALDGRPPLVSSAG